MIIINASIYIFVYSSVLFIEKILIMHAVTEERLQGIAHLLVQACILSEKQILKYQPIAAATEQSLLQYLVVNGIIAASQSAPAIAKMFGLPLLDLDCMDLTSLPLELLNEGLLAKYALIPLFRRGAQLYLATDDPSQQSSLKDIQFHTGLYIHPVVVETDKLLIIIDGLRQKKEHQGLFDYFEKSQPSIKFKINAEENNETYASLNISSNDSPVVKFIHRILMDAINKGVSDIHFEPYDAIYRIRYRQDGLLKVIATPPSGLSARIASRLKIMSALDNSERRLPQDGCFKMNLSTTRAIDIRVSTCPTVAGEKIVLRILDPGIIQLGIETLGFNAHQKTAFIRAISRPQGMILVTGPTGSGKTVTLYTALNHLNTLEKNISTAEDPVEIKVSGINQVNINLKTGLTFANTLRAFLRQDPDIIMIGEVRDLETAEIAIKAAQTGHLVLSTLHTNSAAETLTRLFNMGVASFNIASAVSLIIAQRLIRRLCDHCKIIREDIPSSSLIEQGFITSEPTILQSYKAVGCDQCTNGYRGRVGLFELMPISSALGQLIMSGGTSLDMLQQAQKEGMLTMYQAGIENVKKGITTLEEVNRVTVD